MKLGEILDFVREDVKVTRTQVRARLTFKCGEPQVPGDTQSLVVARRNADVRTGMAGLC